MRAFATPPIRKALGAALALIVLIGVFAVAPASKQVIRRAWGLNQLYLARFRESVSARRTADIDSAGRGVKATPAWSPNPSANLESGAYRAPVHLSLAAPDGAPIHYTTDGSVPTTASPRYTDPLQLNRTTTIRFASFLPGHTPSETVNRTLFVEEPGELPVVMLYIDPVFLWDRYSGIYRNAEARGSAWERDAYLEFLEQRDGSPVGFPVLLRIQGGASRLKPKKSFRVRLPDSHPDSTAALEALLPEAGIPISTVVLRCGGGNTLTRTCDELFQTLYAGAGGHGSVYRPCAVYLNGSYWGIYNIRESMDKEFLKRRFGPGPYSLVENTTRGPRRDRRAWRKVRRFFEEATRSPEVDFAKAESMIDGENLIDYWIFNIYGGNYDWPHWNTHVYRRDKGDDKRWRWISWDADRAFHDKSHNTFAWALRDRLRPELKSPWGDENEYMVRATAFPRVFLRDESFGIRFVNRFCELLNFNLAPETVEPVFERIVDTCRKDVPADLRRWGASEESYRAEIAVIREFVRERPAYLRIFARDVLGLGEPASIDLAADPANGGTVRINGRETGELPWSGVYHEGMTVSLAARAANGYRFRGWAGTERSSGPDIEFDVEADSKWIAQFERVGAH